MSDSKGKRPGRIAERGEGHSGAKASVSEAMQMPEPRAEPAVVVAAPAGDRAPDAEPSAESPAPSRGAAESPAPSRGWAEPPAPSRAAADDAWAMLSEVQAALARGFTEFTLGMTGMTHSSVAVAADAAVALLGARTFAEAVEINATLARRGADAVIEGSAKLSEIGVAAMTETARPLLSRFGAGWPG